MAPRRIFRLYCPRGAPPQPRPEAKFRRVQIGNIPPAQAESFGRQMELTWYGPAKDFPALLPARRAPTAAPRSEVSKSSDREHPSSTSRIFWAANGVDVVWPREGFSGFIARAARPHSRAPKRSFEEFRSGTSLQHKPNLLGGKWS